MDSAPRTPPTGTLRVLALDDHQGVALTSGPRGDLGDDVVVDSEPRHLTGAALRERLAGVHVVLAMRERTPFDADLLSALPDLALLVTTGGANAAIDLVAARREGITVCGTGGLASPTAELTWGLLLALARHLPDEHATVRAGGWQTRVGRGLAGTTLGLVGFGRLGRRVARVARAFEVDVVAWSQHLDPDDARAEGVEPVAFEDLLRRSDAVSVHTRLSERTRGLLGARELALLRPGALLVNTSRGPVVDEAALLDALASGHLGGAALDVYDVEPLPADHPLRSAPNVVLTPHVGYVTADNYAVFHRDAVEDVAAWRAGDPVRVLTTPGG